MENKFILANSDVQYANVEKDPLVYYKENLSDLGLEFWSTYSKDGWNNFRNYIFGGSQNAAQKSEVNLNLLGVENKTYQRGGQKADWGYYDKFSEWTEKCGYIVSSNYAHNMTAMLSRAAFENKGIHGIKTIINFDYHEDYGKLESPNLKVDSLVDNGAWGQEHTCRSWPRIENKQIVLVYAVFGVSGSGSHDSLFWRVSKSKQLDTDKPQKRTSAKGDIVNKLKKILFDPSDVYITIDRDVLQNGRTHFNKMKSVKGTYARGDITDTIENIMGSLNFNLVGFDITGLPAWDQKSMTPSDDADSNACEAAVEDIKEWHRILSTYCAYS